MVTVHSPPAEIVLPSTGELYFLAGPIQGAPDWQKEAITFCDQIGSIDPNIDSLEIANPRRDYLDGQFDYDAQVEWEQRYLRRAATYGGIIFWLARQDHSLPYEKGRPYAQTTRFEFGRSLGWRDFDPTIRVVIGMEPGYKGSERYYKKCAAEQGLKIYSDLGETCAALLSRES